MKEIPSAERRINMKRSAQAIWEGTLREGRGSLTTDSGALSQTPYTFGTRFESQKGTNPEELVAAAHAGCFSMALSFELQKAKLSPRTIRTKATASLEQVQGEWSIVAISLDLTASVSDAEKDRFLQAAETAKSNCPISKLLNATISLNINSEISKSEAKNQTAEAANTAP